MFADVLINHPYSRKQETFTYSVPEEMQIKKGMGVLVPFQKGTLAGLVIELHDNKPSFELKEIASRLAEEPLLAEWQIKLAEWISEYYFCSKFDALRLFLPKNIFRVPKKARKTVNKKIVQEIKEKQLVLTEEQEIIVNSILKDKHPTSLIHGITGAGKTEIYKSLIKNFVQEAKQCLLLVPEISLTPQLVNQFKSLFPNLAVIHSRVSDGKKAELWKEIQSGQIPLVIGSRSAIFSPFKNLGLIVMDEEHEWSYKQDNSPRYNAKDVALKIQELTGTQIVFGSATPSIETAWHAKENRYKLFTMSSRILGTPLPKVEIVDMREELKGGNFGIWSTVLEQKISSALAQKEQVILFLNRRGSASSTVCRDCGYTATCKNCELPLTYHARNFANKSLICHHCGLIMNLPDVCPTCKSTRIRHFGIGTERVENELKLLFPLAKIIRADKDTMSKKDSFENLHKALHNKEIDILIGTQMIGKGFDIPDVTLVGVMLADMGLHVPDFRTSERIFQLLTQVAGRAGRRKKQGEVIIQTYSPSHIALRMSQTHDYNGFYEQEICARKEAGFPPFGRIAKLMILDENERKCQEKARKLTSKLQSIQDEYLVLSAPALFTKVNGKYQWNILIHGANPNELITKLSQEDLAGWKIDIDPMISV
ncbi:MAG: primosomal protein N' [Candidatus Gracilibacteria bacterium]